MAQYRSYRKRKTYDELFGKDRRQGSSNLPLAEFYDKVDQTIRMFRLKLALIKARQHK